MSLWKRIASRLRSEEDPARTPDVGMTYADLERDKPRKEALLSGAGFSEPRGDPDDAPPARAEDEGAAPPGPEDLR